MMSFARPVLDHGLGLRVGNEDRGPASDSPKSAMGQAGWMPRGPPGFAGTQGVSCVGQALELTICRER